VARRGWDRKEIEALMGSGSLPWCYVCYWGVVFGRRAQDKSQLPFPELRIQRLALQKART